MKIKKNAFEHLFLFFSHRQLKIDKNISGLFLPMN